MEAWFNWVLLGASVICIAISIYLLTSRKYQRSKHDNLEHYEDIRDKVVKKENNIKEEENQDSEEITGGIHFGRIHFGNIVGGLVTLGVGVSVLTTMNRQLFNNMNVTQQFPTEALSLLNFAPIFFTVAVIGTIVITILKVGKKI